MNRRLRLLIARLIAAVPTLFLVALGAFLLLELAPGDAVDAYLAQTGGDQGFAQELRRQLGLGGTVLERLGGFLLSLLSLDLGRSVIFSRPVTTVIAERLPNTLLLMATTTLFAAGIGLVLGTIAGARPGSSRDRAISGAAFLLLAIPNFWLALLLIVAFVVSLGLFPIGGIRTIGLQADAFGHMVDALRHLVLPTVALGAGYVALYLRTLRAGMEEAWPSEFVRAARARGVAEGAILWRGVVRPALLPTAVVAGQNMATLVGGSVVVETVFAIPGTGRLAFEAVAGRDTALLIGAVMTATLLVIAINLAVDLLMTRLDPRVGAERG
jgi:peptide/nickel transport system permease protein